MSWKRLFPALFVLAVVGGGYYYFDVVKAGKTESAKDAARKLFRFDTEKVTGVTIAKPKEAPIEIAKVDGKWKIVGPLTSRADEGTVSQIIVSASNLVSDEKLDAPGDLKQYGLDDPAIISLKTGAETKSIKIGGATPILGKTYVLEPDGKTVAVVAETSLKELTKSLFELRDKRIFQFDDKSVIDLAVIIEQTPQISVEKTKDAAKKDVWKITHPIKAEADIAEAERLVSKVVTARIMGWVDKPARDLGEYGLNSPQYTIKVVGDEGKTTSTLYIGKDAGQKDYYARAQDSINVFKVSVELVKTISEPAETLLDRNLFHDKFGRMKKLTLETASGRVSLTEGGDVKGDKLSPLEGSWTMTEPEKTKGDSNTVTEILHNLENLKGSGIAVDGDYDPSFFGLDKPAVKVTAGFEKGEKTAMFGMKAKGKDVSYFVTAAGSKKVLSIDAETFKIFDRDAKSFKDTRVLNVNSADIGRIVITRVGQTFDIKRDGVEVSVSGAEQGKVNAVVWQRFAWMITGIRFESELDPKQAEGKFAKPPLDIAVYDTKGAPMDRITVGDKADGGKGYYMKTSKGKTYLIGTKFVTQDIIDQLEGLFAKR